MSDSGDNTAYRGFAEDMDSHSGRNDGDDGSFSHYDGDDYGCSQSYDDFLDEQDDYDMMDDDF